MRILAFIIALLVGSQCFAGTRRWTPHIQTAYSDNFNRADGTLGANWTTNATDIPATETTFKIASNTAHPSADANHAFALWTNGSFTSDQFSQVKLVNLGQWNGCCVRATRTVDDFYFAFVFGANDYRFYLRTPGTYTQIIGYSADTWASGDTLRLQVIGHDPTLMFMFHNGVSCANFAYYDGSGGFTGGFPGIATYSPVAANLGVDDWQGGNSTLPASTLTDDNFTRSDAISLGSNYVNGVTGECKISGNTCIVDPIYYSGNPAKDICLRDNGVDQFASVKVNAIGGGGSDWAGPIVGSNFKTEYLVITLGALPNTFTGIYAFDGVTYNNLVTSGSVTWHANDIIGLRRTGTSTVTLTVTQNGSDTSVVATDTTYTYNGHHSGLAIHTSAGGTVLTAYHGAPYP